MEVKKKRSMNSLEKIEEFLEIKSIVDRIESLVISNIVDYSVIKEITDLFIQHNFNVNKIELYKSFITFFYELFDKLWKKYKVDVKSNYYYQNNAVNLVLLVNLSIYLMIILYNCGETKSFLESLMEKNSKLLDLIVRIAEDTGNYDIKNKRVEKILHNLFENEYKVLFNNNKLDDLFNYNEEKFSNRMRTSFEVLDNNIYISLLRFLMDFNINYEKVFDKKILVVDEVPLIKQMFIQSIIRLIFSKEKDKYTDDKYYEYNFLKSVTRKCVSYYRQKFGEKINSLFRRDEIFDDIIKYILYIYGNSLLQKAYIDNIKDLAFEMQNTFENENVDFLGRFEYIFDEFIKNMTRLTPIAIKLILKILYETVLEFYTMDKQNYNPLLTYLIFNFVISPKLQEIYNISPSKFQFVRNMNRLIRNICFNEKFRENDELFKYNGIIKESNLKIIKCIENILFSIQFHDEVKFTSQIRKYLDFPKFMFYYDSSFIYMFLQNLDHFKMNRSSLIKQSTINSGFDIVFIEYKEKFEIIHEYINHK